MVPSHVVEVGIAPGGADGVAKDRESFPYSDPVGACLLHHWKVWRELGVDPRVVRVLRKGFSIKFLQPCPLTSVPGYSRMPSDPLKVAVLDEEVRQLTLKAAIEPVPVGQACFHSHLFLVPKPGGKWRPVIDLKALNRTIDIPSFSMETPESIRALMRPGDWAVSIDLSDAYFHIPIRPRFRRFLTFCHRGKLWQFRALPFGLSTAPWIFTRVMEEVRKLAAVQGITMHMYIDDWLIRAQSPVIVQSQCEWFLHLCARLGLRVNFLKSDLVPAQEFTFIGYRFVTQLHRVFPPLKRVDILVPLLDSFLTSRSHTAFLWERLLGLLASTEKLVPLGRCHMRGLQSCLATQWDCTSQSQQVPVLVDWEATQDLLWWSSPEALRVGVPTHPLQWDLQVFTDSSTTGWGAHCLDQVVSGQWSPQELLLHINNLGLLAVYRALLHWQTLVLDKVVLVVTDNTTVVSYINKQGGTRSRSLARTATEMLAYFFGLGVTIRANHIAGKLNVLADSLSRKGQILHTEWSLSPQIFRQICQALGTPHIDLFATSLNTKLPVYVSPYPDPLAWDTDALSMS